MLAVAKTALSKEPVDFREILLQIFLGQLFHAHGIEGGKAGGICHKTAVIQLEQLHMTGGVSAPGNFLAHISHLQPETTVDAVENAGLADGGVAGKGTDLARQHGFDLFHTFTGDSAGAQHRETGLLISMVQVHAVVQVGFVQQDHRLDALIKSHHRHLVDQIGIGNRRCLRAQDHQLVDICDSGPDQSVSPWQPLGDVAAVVGDPQFHIFPRCQQVFLMFNFGAGTAAQNLTFAGHIIVAANAFDHDALFLDFH